MPPSLSEGMSEGEQYRVWGEWIWEVREVGTAWGDGSKWTDGVSVGRPALPLAEGESVANALTCTQREILLMTAFPPDEDLETWHADPRWEAIAEEWEEGMARLLWGQSPRARASYAAEPFAQRCGKAVSAANDTPWKRRFNDGG